jgi:hypothetical protein
MRGALRVKFFSMICRHVQNRTRRGPAIRCVTWNGLHEISEPHIGISDPKGSEIRCVMAWIRCMILEPSHIEFQTRRVWNSMCDGLNSMHEFWSPHIEFQTLRVWNSMCDLNSMHEILEPTHRISDPKGLKFDVWWPEFDAWELEPTHRISDPSGLKFDVWWPEFEFEFQTRRVWNSNSMHENWSPHRPSHIEFQTRSGLKFDVWPEFDAWDFGAHTSNFRPEGSEIRCVMAWIRCMKFGAHTSNFRPFGSEIRCVMAWIRIRISDPKGLKFEFDVWWPEFDAWDFAAHTSNFRPEGSEIRCVMAWSIRRMKIGAHTSNFRPCTGLKFDVWCAWIWHDVMWKLEPTQAITHRISDPKGLKFDVWPEFDAWNFASPHIEFQTRRVWNSMCDGTDWWPEIGAHTSNFRPEGSEIRCVMAWIRCVMAWIRCMILEPTHRISDPYGSEIRCVMAWIRCVMAWIGVTHRISDPKGLKFWCVWPLCFALNPLCFGPHPLCFALNPLCFPYVSLIYPLCFPYVFIFYQKNTKRFSKYKEFFRNYFRSQLRLFISIFLKNSK